MTIGRMIERVSDRVLATTPLQPVFHRIASRHLRVLAYHDVRDADLFERQLAYIRQRLAPVSLDEVCSAVRRGAALPENAVLVTFDDGDRTVFERALPILEEKRIPAVAFVIAGLVDTDRPFWWAEVEHLVRNGGTARGVPTASPRGCVRALKQMSNDARVRAVEELRASARSHAPGQKQLRADELLVMEHYGIEVANHTHTHPCLDKCSDAEAQDELASAHHRLSNILGRSVRAFAYPNGNRDLRSERMLQDLGYEVAFLFDHMLTNRQLAEPLAISRLRVNSTTSIDRFKLIVSGFHPFLHRALGRA